jgi:hypothetical protein
MLEEFYRDVSLIELPCTPPFARVRFAAVSLKAVVSPLFLRLLPLSGVRGLDVDSNYRR